MKRSVQQVCETAVAMLVEYAPVEVVCERYSEREPHSGGQEAFRIRARFPWHSRLQTRVMIEVTIDERILWPVERLPVIHEYGERSTAGV